MNEFTDRLERCAGIVVEEKMGGRRNLNYRNLAGPKTRQIGKVSVGFAVEKKFRQRQGDEFVKKSSGIGLGYSFKTVSVVSTDIDIR